MTYFGNMYCWRVSIFGKSPARPLGTISAPDDEKAATAKAIEYFCVEEALQFGVVLGRPRLAEAPVATSQPGPRPLALILQRRQILRVPHLGIPVWLRLSGRKKRPARGCVASREKQSLHHGGIVEAIGINPIGDGDRGTGFGWLTPMVDLGSSRHKKLTRRWWDGSAKLGSS
jgi:hypothetical protein